MIKNILFCCMFFFSIHPSGMAKGTACNKINNTQIRCKKSLTSFDKSFLYRHGVSKEFFKNKKMKRVGSYHNGFKTGEWSEFHSNGKLYIQEYFFKGLHFKHREIFNTKGKLVKRFIYPTSIDIKQAHQWASEEEKKNISEIISSLLKKEDNHISKVVILDGVKNGNTLTLHLVITRLGKKIFTSSKASKTEKGWKIW